MKLASAPSLSSIVAIFLASAADVFPWHGQSLDSWLAINGFVPQHPPRSTGKTSGGALILNVRVGGQCDMHLRTRCSVLKGCEVAAGKTQGTQVSSSVPLVTAGSLCDLGSRQPVSHRTQF